MHLIKTKKIIQPDAFLVLQLPKRLLYPLQHPDLLLWWKSGVGD
jgi:hypothetical protein